MNTKIEYLYRSGANYKWAGEVILPGVPVCRMATYEAALRGTCETDDHFIASQVGLPSCFPWETGHAAYEDDEDHCYHEFASAVATDESPTLDIEPSAMLARFQSAHKEGWEAFDPAETNTPSMRI